MKDLNDEHQHAFVAPASSEPAPADIVAAVHEARKEPEYPRKPAPVTVGDAATLTVREKLLIHAITRSVIKSIPMGVWNHAGLNYNAIAQITESMAEHRFNDLLAEREGRREGTHDAP